MITASPHLFTTEAVVKTLCLPRIDSRRRHSNMSGLSCLCDGSGRQEQLDQLVSFDPSIFATEAVLTALFITCHEINEINENRCGFYSLCETHRGQAILSKLINANSDIFKTDDLIMVLKRSLTGGEDDGKNALSWLLASPYGTELLLKMAIHNPLLRSEIDSGTIKIPVEDAAAKDPRFFQPASPLTSSDVVTPISTL